MGVRCAWAGGLEGQETGAEKEAGGRREEGKQRSRRLTIVGTGVSWFQSQLFTAIVLAFITEDVRSTASARHASVKITVNTHIYTHSENASHLSQVLCLVRGRGEMRAGGWRVRDPSSRASLLRGTHINTHAQHTYMISMGCVYEMHLKPVFI